MSPNRPLHGRQQARPRDHVKARVQAGRPAARAEVATFVQHSVELLRPRSGPWPPGRGGVALLGESRPRSTPCSARTPSADRARFSMPRHLFTLMQEHDDLFLSIPEYIDHFKPKEHFTRRPARGGDRLRAVARSTVWPVRDEAPAVQGAVDVAAELAASRLPPPAFARADWAFDLHRFAFRDGGRPVVLDPYARTEENVGRSCPVVVRAPARVGARAPRVRPCGGAGAASDAQVTAGSWLLLGERGSHEAPVLASLVSIMQAQRAFCPRGSSPTTRRRARRGRRALRPLPTPSRLVYGPARSTPSR